MPDDSGMQHNCDRKESHKIPSECLWKDTPTPDAVERARRQCALNQGVPLLTIDADAFHLGHAAGAAKAAALREQLKRVREMLGEITDRNFTYNLLMFLTWMYGFVDAFLAARRRALPQSDSGQDTP